MSASTSYASPEAALADIRGLMRRSGRFLSLSGLSGVWAGACALAAAAYAYMRAGVRPLSGVDYYTAYYRQYQDATAIEPFVLAVGVVTMAAAVAGAAFFTVRRARATGAPIWSAAARQMLGAMLAPLVTGGVLVLAHWHQGDFGYSAALTLVFYGLALLAVARYTVPELRTLGYVEIGLGLLVAFFPGYGIDAWALGFGLGHIVYGALIWWRYER